RLQISYERSPTFSVERARKLLVMGVSAWAPNYIGRGARAPPSTPSGGGGFPDLRLDALDDGATEAALALVRHRVLAGCNGALQPLEAHADRAVRSRLQQPPLIRPGGNDFLRRAERPAVA